MSKIRSISLLALSLSFAPCLASAATTTQTSVSGQPRRLAQAIDFELKEKGFESALVIDAKTKKVLYSYQPDKKWPAASLTKLVGAMVYLDRKPAWNSVVAMSKADEVGGGRLRVNPGAKLTVRDLLYSSIVGSANNAATAMARLSKLGMKNFVANMNKKAKAIGCTQTNFYDASGMDARNLTTVQDMARIADAAFNVPEIRRAATTASYTFKILNASPKNNLHTVKNTNVLLVEDNGLYVTGGKTGYLDESKNNLIVRLRPSAVDRSKEVLVVVFGAESRQSLFAEAERLARWSWSAYDWSTPMVAKAYGN
ncbi:MAG: serine hydrolase [Patescibacteria group bacterium]|nr:serine hydrolase [Patescibacteria group bacterium]